MRKGFGIVVIALLLGAFGVSAAHSLTLMIDGKKLCTYPRPLIRHGRVFVPVSAVKSIGLWVDWHMGGNSAEVAWPESDVFIHFDSGKGAFNVGLTEEQYEISKRNRIMPPSFMRRGFLMVPLRTIAEGDFSLRWNGRTSTVNVVRPAAWTRWRRSIDAELLKSYPDKYGRVF